MRIKIIEKLGGGVREIEGVVAIVEDVHGNPIQIACELQPGVYDLANIKQDGRQFNNMLRALGIDKVVVAEKLAADSPPDGSKLLYNPLAR